MKDDAGSIDDAAQGVALFLVDFIGDGEMEFAEPVFQAVVRVLSFGNLLPDAEEHGSCGTDHGAVGFNSKDRGEVGAEQEIVERGQQTVKAACFGIGGGVLAVFHGSTSGSLLFSIVCR